MFRITQKSCYQSFGYRRNCDQVRRLIAIIFSSDPLFILYLFFREQPFFLYRMSYLWYTWVGFLTAILVGLLVSWITGLNKCKPGDEKLYTPVIRSFLRDSTTITKQEQVKLSKIIYLKYLLKINVPHNLTLFSSILAGNCCGTRKNG